MAVGIPLFVASACDVSPSAVKVNHEVIKQTVVNSELRSWSGNSAYVAAFNSSNNSSGLTVAGDAPGTYSMSWVANILNGIIQGAAVHQHLAARDNLPDQATMAAARSVGEISQVGWYEFSPGFRETLVQRLADEATFTPPSVPASTLRDVYQHYQSYFFVQVCTLEDSAPTLDQAKALAASGVSNGSPGCNDQVQFEAQPAAYRTAVQGTAVGHVAPPIQTNYGYQVVKVQSRVEQGFTPNVQRVLSVAVLAAEGSPNNAVNQLLNHTSVQLNPMYGTWKAPSVVPPSVPGSSS